MRSSLIADTSNLDSAHDDSTFRIVLWPAAIAIAVTVLRAVGELNRWPKPLVNSAPCGKAILGVTWLVPLVGAYFVFKLARAHERPTQLRFTFVAALVGACLEARWHLPFGVRQVQLRDSHHWRLRFDGGRHGLSGIDLASFVQAPSGLRLRVANSSRDCAMAGTPRPLGYTLRRIGQFPADRFWPTYIRVSLVPNIFFMEAYTVIVGALVGTAALAILEAIKRKST